ncbi:DNA-directed RNA polymerases I and III subunit RPAC2 isoform X1 [Gorilla gorilla gorilla]
MPRPAAGPCRAAAAPPPSFRPPRLTSVGPSFLPASPPRLALWDRAPDPPAAPEDPETAPAMEEDQELERKISGLKTSMAEGERKTALEMVQAAGTDRHCVTFVLHEEDHTLGNSLRYMIMKNPEVEFCGYTTTHPSESKINLRIQTRGTLPAVEPFQRGLNELMNVCQHVLDKFEASIKDYKDQKASRNESTF